MMHKLSNGSYVPKPPILKCTSDVFFIHVSQVHGLLPLKHWDHEFGSRRKHGQLFMFFCNWLICYSRIPATCLNEDLQSLHSSG